MTKLNPRIKKIAGKPELNKAYKGLYAHFCSMQDTQIDDSSDIATKLKNMSYGLAKVIVETGGEQSANKNERKDGNIDDIEYFGNIAPKSIILKSIHDLKIEDFPISKLLEIIEMTNGGKTDDTPNTNMKDGFVLGSDGNPLIRSSGDKVEFLSALVLPYGDGLMNWERNVILSTQPNGDVFLNAGGGDLSIGGENTKRVVLLNDIYTSGKKPVITRTGKINALDGLTVNYKGSLVAETECQKGWKPYLSIATSLQFGNSPVHLFADNGVFKAGTKTQNVQFTTKQSESYYRDRRINGYALSVDTEGLEFISFSKPIQSKEFIVGDTQTKLSDNALFFSNGRITNVTSGLQVGGNLFLSDNLQSTRFKSGLAGYGFGAFHNRMNNTYEVVADDIVARRKFKAYEFEVQKYNASNGSLWITDSCSADEVQEISVEDGETEFETI